MFLKRNRRVKDGKDHYYWNIVENKRVRGGRIVQRQVLYLGEINDSQQMAWRKSIEIFEEGRRLPEQISLFPEERAPEIDDESIVRIRLKDLRVERPRQWGACWLACLLYEQLGLDEFWRERLPDSREGTRWTSVLQTLVAYRLIAPGSEWRLHREWFERSAMAELLGEDFSIAEKNTLYRCHDRLLPHKKALFAHLTQKWTDLFNARYDVLLYDLTSTYFESDPNDGPASKSRLRKFGYSRDKRSDCQQVVIALIVTPEAFPIAYEVLPGNTQDKTTLHDFLKRIEDAYGKANRVWVMDRGIPTEEVLEQMRESDPPVSYLVGTPRSALAKYEEKLLSKDWQNIRPGIDVKLLGSEGENYVLARSDDRVLKEKSMRLRRLRALVKTLKKLRDSKRIYKRDTVLIKLGEAKKSAGPKVWALLNIEITPNDAPEGQPPVTFSLNWKKYRQAYRREGRYLLRTNLNSDEPEKLWSYYIQLTEIEQVFKEMKNDLAIRPIYHQTDQRIEAHIFISFLAYCLWITLKHRLKALAPGLTPAEVLSKMSAMQMLDVRIPTADGRTIVLNRYTEPNDDQTLLLNQLKLKLPPQPPPKIESKFESL
ncbi:MAG: IS1634 family transposase [Opitutales bacterium]